MEPAIFDSKEEAEEFIKDEKQFVSGPDLIGPSDPYVYWVEPVYSELESQLCVKCGDAINDLSEYPDRNDIDVCWNCDRGFCERDLTEKV
jgi:hypothetical protein